MGGGGAGAQWTMTPLQQMSKQAFWLPEYSPVCYMQPLVTGQRENAWVNSKVHDRSIIYMVEGGGGRARAASALRGRAYKVNETDKKSQSRIQGHAHTPPPALSLPLTCCDDGLHALCCSLDNAPRECRRCCAVALPPGDLSGGRRKGEGVLGGVSNNTLHARYAAPRHTVRADRR